METEIASQLSALKSAGATVAVMYDLYAGSGNFMNIVASQTDSAGQPLNLAGNRTEREGMLWFLSGDTPILKDMDAAQRAVLYGTLAMERYVSPSRSDALFAQPSMAAYTPSASVAFLHDCALALAQAAPALSTPPSASSQ